MRQIITMLSHWLRKRIFLVLGVSLITLPIIGVIAFWAYVLPLSEAIPSVGFANYIDSQGEAERARRVSDLLTLLLILLLFALGGLGFTFRLRKQERAFEAQSAEEQQALAQARFREETLQAYFEKMTELLLKEKLNTPGAPEAVKNAAFLRTITVLRQLDHIRRNRVMDFLRDAQLLDGEVSLLKMQLLDGIDLSRTSLSMANLSGSCLAKTNMSRAHLYETNLTKATMDLADLTEAYLLRANLSGARLNRANLSRAYISKTNLSEAKLTEADLSRANLSGANLSGADLRGANLCGATLNETILLGANLTGALVTPEQLAQAVLNKQTIMPKGKPRGSSQ